MQSIVRWVVSSMVDYAGFGSRFSCHQYCQAAIISSSIVSSSIISTVCQDRPAVTDSAGQSSHWCWLDNYSLHIESIPVQKWNSPCGGQVFCSLVIITMKSSLPLPESQSIAASQISNSVPACWKMDGRAAEGSSAMLSGHSWILPHSSSPARYT